MKQPRRLLLGLLTVTMLAGISAAQLGPGGGRRGNRNQGGNIGAQLGGFGGIFGGGGGGGRGGRGFGGEYLTGNEPMQPLPADRNGVARWEVNPQFKDDVFTFVRLRFTTVRGGFGRGGGTGTSWLNDWPEADINVSFRLQQMTSLKVNPDPIQLQIYDDRLLDYPFAFMNQVGALQFTDREVTALRRYLLNGGFLMVDDHWGNDQRNWAQQIRRVFPDREPKELTLDHPIFHCVFDLKALPQVPTLQLWERDAQAGRPEQTARAPDYAGPIYRAIYDDKGRMMVIEDANTDTSDGWEREGDEEEYFHRFSEKQAYPLMINIISYAMTH